MCTIKQLPGKFEGETCITHLAYEWTMNGFGSTEWDELGDPTDTFHGPFTDLSHRETGMLCLECRNDLLGAKRVMFWQDDNRFAYSKVG